MAVRRERRRVGVVAGEFLDAAGRAWVELVDKVPGSPRGFLESLQPAWWVLRAWVAWMVLQDMVHLQVDYGLDWLVLLVVAVVGSVQLGRAGGVVARIRAHTAARLVLVGLNVLAICLLPGVDRARWASAYDVLNQQGYESSEYSIGLFYDGVELTNLIPYDAEGKPLTGVQLFTQDGRAVAINEGITENDGASIVYPWLSNGTPRFNVFPLPVGPLDEETWERDPDAWTSAVAPRLPDLPFAVAPEVSPPAEPLSPRIRLPPRPVDSLLRLPSGRPRTKSAPVIRLGRAAQRVGLRAGRSLRMAVGTDAETKKIIAEYATDRGRHRLAGGADRAAQSHRIGHLTEHLKEREHDHHSRRGLLLLVGQRRRLLNYLQKTEIERYRSIVERLGLRR